MPVAEPQPITLSLDLDVAPLPATKREADAIRKESRRVRDSAKHRGVAHAERIRESGSTRLGGYLYLEGATGERELERICARLSANPRPVVVDLETTGLDAIQDEILLVAFTFDGQRAYVFSPREIDPAPFVRVLETCPIVNHNVKFDWKFWRAQWGVEAKIAWDTYVTHAVALSGLGKQLGGHGLNALSRRYLKVTLNKDARSGFHITGVWRTNKQIAYAAEDVLSVWRLIPVTKELLRRSGQEKIWETFEKPLIPVLADMELAGMRVDIEAVKTARVEYEKKLVAAEATLEGLAPGTNYNSFDQIKAFFLDALGEENLPRKRDKKTNEDKISFDKKALSFIAHPVARAIEDCRDYSKVIGSFLIPWSEGKYNRVTGSIHTTYTQVDTDTGRMSAREPNLQQVPQEQEFRSCFVAPPGQKVITADYSQFELRILSQVSGDENMAAVFFRREEMLAEYDKRKAEGEAEDSAGMLDLHRRIGLSDHHAQTALLMFGLNIDDFESVDDPAFKKYRKMAKCINFGIPYQLGARALAANIDKSLEETQKLLDDYFALYAKVQGYIDGQKSLGVYPVARMGYALCVGGTVSSTLTLGGRRRWYRPPSLDLCDDADEEVAAEARWMRAAIQRRAVNHPIQGTNGDVIKLALIRLHRALRERYPEAQLRMAVHDEIVVTAPEAIAQEVAALQVEIMVAAGKEYLPDLPVECTIEVADTWSK